MNRMVTRAKEPNIVKVARLGDTIAYRDLISKLKTDAVAEYLCATPKSVANGGVVVLWINGRSVQRSKFS